MNKIFRLIRHTKTDQSIPVSEISRLGKKISNRIGFSIIILMLLASETALALPENGDISAGTGSFQQVDNQMTINQNSQNLSINWQSFAINTGETVKFSQPNANAIALNRVIGPDPSNIFGTLSANGQVFITNPNGILFGPDAQVNVGGLVASTLNISDTDLLEQNYIFQNPGTGEIGRAHV